MDKEETIDKICSWWDNIGDDKKLEFMEEVYLRENKEVVCDECGELIPEDEIFTFNFCEDCAVEKGVKDKY